MHPPDLEARMDKLAPAISELLGIGEFELLSTRGGNLNYSFVLEAAGGTRYFVKQFDTRIQREKVRYRARAERYQVEKAALDACQQRLLPAPDLSAYSTCGSFCLFDSLMQTRSSTRLPSQ